MLLSERMSTEIEILAERTGYNGRPYFEAALIGDDGQTLHLFEGQLKELPDVEPQVGARYRATFRPFINNRWVELKISSLQPLEA